MCSEVSVNSPGNPGSQFSESSDVSETSFLSRFLNIFNVFKILIWTFFYIYALHITVGAYPARRCYKEHSNKEPRERLTTEYRVTDRVSTIRMAYTQGDSDVTESVVTIRSPFCGYNTTKCVKLNGKDCHVAQIKSNHLV